MKQIFPMAPPGPAAKIISILIFLFVAIGAAISTAVVSSNIRWMHILVMIPTFGIAYVILSRVGKVTFEVGDGMLYIRGDFLRHKILIQDLRLMEARRLDRNDELGLMPKVRMSGTMLPGYSGGWFQMSGGKKGLVYLTDLSKAIYLPTNLGYPIILTPNDPEAFLRALRAG